MQFTLSFSALLAGLLITLSMQVVDAAPLPKPDSKFISLHLTRVKPSGSYNLHPQIALQQHINRSVRRLAMMSGRNAPSQQELESRLHKRVVKRERRMTLEKRFDRTGVPRKFEDAALEKRFNRAGVPAKQGSSTPGLSLKAKKSTPASASPASSSGVTFANPPTASNSLGLDIEAHDVGYLATIQMGTPPRDFLLLMDSGSADLWVGSENCQSEGKRGGGCGNHNFLGSQSSSSFQDSGNPFQVTYGTGNVNGTIISDNVAVAGLALPGHTFGVATLESIDFSSGSTPFDGIMGLAQSTLSEQQTLTPVESLASAGLIQDAIVSYKISRLADNKNDGEITFGGLDPTKFDPNTLVTLPNVNQDGFWEAALDSASVNGVDTGLKGRTTILDTGTTLLVAPANDAAALHQNIPGAQSDGQGGFTVPCTTNASVALTYGGQTFTIDPRDIAFQPVDPNNPQGDCVSGIASGDVGGPTEWLVGDTFLKNAYFSTDVTKNTLSLAKLV